VVESGVGMHGWELPVFFLVKLNYYEKCLYFESLGIIINYYNLLIGMYAYKTNRKIKQNIEQQL
jgi:hypothetical protein